MNATVLTMNCTRVSNTEKTSVWILYGSQIPELFFIALVSVLESWCEPVRSRSVWMTEGNEYVDGSKCWNWSSEKGRSLLSESVWFMNHNFIRWMRINLNKKWSELLLVWWEKGRSMTIDAYGRRGRRDAFVFQYLSPTLRDTCWRVVFGSTFSFVHHLSVS